MKTVNNENSQFVPSKTLSNFGDNVKEDSHSKIELQTKKQEDENLL